MWSFSELENKTLLLGDIAKCKELFFQGVISCVGLGGWGGKKGGYSFFLFFFSFLSHNMLT